MKYCFIQDSLGWRNPNGLILRCVSKAPTLFTDVHAFVKVCKSCQFFTGKKHLTALPLQPVMVEAPFQQWNLDFIKEFKDNSSNGHK
jgi:hypothetical protein